MTREEAIKYFEKRKEKALMLMEKSKADTPINNQVRGTLTRKIEALDMAISALSENKGKWEKIWRTDAECSEYICSKCDCGEDYPTDFCPNCGADMRGE